jgi:hypothetical protein
MTNEPGMPAMPPACSGNAWMLMDIVSVGHSEKGSISQASRSVLD